MVNDDSDKWSDDGDLPINSVNNTERLDERPKRKNINRFNDKEISMEEQISMEELMNGSKYRKESVNGLEKQTKKYKLKEEPIKDLEKNGKESVKSSMKDIPTKTESIKEEPTKVSVKDALKEEPVKDLTQENQELKNKLAKLKEETKELKEPSYLKDLTKYIKNLDSTIKELATDLKESTNARSSISKGNITVQRYANYYDVSNIIGTAGISDPNDFDSSVYNAERIFESLDRYAEIIYVANDGTDNLYVIVSHGGRTRFSQEAPIYPGEVKCYFNIYEIRLRSPTAGLPYRVTEYCINTISEISNIPIQQAILHNQALPTANSNWLSSDITPINTPTNFRIQVAVSVSGNFETAITQGGYTQIVILNILSGPALIADGLYEFEILVHEGDSVNFRYSVTGGTIRILRVQEIDSATA